MSFKKLDQLLKDIIQHLGYEKPLPFQEKTISKIKGGASLFGIGPKGCGKTSTLIINTIQKIKDPGNHDNPRALIFVKDKAAALALEEEFKKFTKHNGLRVYSVYEEQNINGQKDIVYEGVDIVITTTKRLAKLYHLNGINLGELNLLIVEDAEFLLKEGANSAEIIRITESLQKCQYLIFATKFEEKLSRLQNYFMSNAQVITIK